MHAYVMQAHMHHTCMSFHLCVRACVDASVHAWVRMRKYNSFDQVCWRLNCRQSGRSAGGRPGCPLWCGWHRVRGRAPDGRPVLPLSRPRPQPTHSVPQGRLAADVQDECGLFGEVVEVAVHVVRGVPSLEQVRVFVRFAKAEACVEALGALHGRRFAGRVVYACFWDEAGAVPGGPLSAPLRLPLFQLRVGMGRERHGISTEERSHRHAHQPTRATRATGPAHRPLLCPISRRHPSAVSPAGASGAGALSSGATDAAAPDGPRPNPHPRPYPAPPPSPGLFCDLPRCAQHRPPPLPAHRLQTALHGSDSWRNRGGLLRAFPHFELSCWGQEGGGCTDICPFHSGGGGSVGGRALVDLPCPAMGSSNDPRDVIFLDTMLLQRYGNSCPNEFCKSTKRPKMVKATKKMVENTKVVGKRSISPENQLQFRLRLG